MNRLALETSPYLLQHAANPVDWHPWAPEAFELARREGKPVLLSIGYSACHWCHVMAHESFEDAATAEVMNALFVNIKVDREERPDVDRIYQAAHHLMMRRGGGWPLTVFLNPEDQAPFFAGTYFPNEPRYGMPSFVDVLKRVAEYWHRRPPELKNQAPALREALASIDAARAAAPGEVDTSALAGFRRVVAQQFDGENGGFGGAPKFPHPSSLEQLLRAWWRTARSTEPDMQALYMTALTMQRMADGGIYDHLGGGFCRYAVDATWTIPHFEKMLYDNGPLLALAAWLWQVGGDETFRRVAAETADWVLRDMRSPEGGFYSSLDADSEGEEGLFYIWTPDAVRGLVTAGEYAVFAPRYGLDGEPNFEGHWHLRVQRPLESIAESAGQPLSTVRRLIDDARAKLLAERSGRVWPGRDEKVLASWNALMIRGLAVAARALQRPDYGDAAAGALDFVRRRMVVDGRLCATYKDGRARFNAYLDDHAFLLEATLELLQVRWNDAHLAFAIWLADQLLDRFAGPDGAFYFTSHDHEALLHRSRPLSDDALPSGNAVAAASLQRLGHLLGETRYLDAATRVLHAAWHGIREFPQGHASFLTALDEWLEPPELVILRGEPAALADWVNAAATLYAPRRLVFAIPPAASLPAGLAAKSASGPAVAYLCRGTSCGPPLKSLESLATALTEQTEQGR
ncbi:MAG: thioredoxin domain-containing protein [Gammaproteobacteria bacterium]|nr:thioredoxin domain-containing protein [Gammaproteobacteria bacterium]